MNTHFESNLATISTADLHIVTGGDAGGDYTKQISQDFLDTGGRGVATIDALQKKDWGNAAVHGVQTLVDGVKVMSDAWSPVKDFLGLGKS